MRRPVKNKKSRILYVIPVVLLIAATIYTFLKQSDSSLPPNRAMITGTVSFYGDKYKSAADGPVILTVDGKEIDTGGGLRPSKIYGSFDEKAKKVGQKVKARVRVEDINGKKSYTIYNCRDCYIKVI